MVGVYSLDGKKISTTELPSVFKVKMRKDLIKRAVVAQQSHRLQAYGPNWFSGKDTSAFSFGSGRNLSKIPRITGGGSTRGRGAIVPQAVGGRRAHPPVPDRVYAKKINKKETNQATASAIASTASKEHVESRGHLIADVPELPIVVSEDLEDLKKTKDVKEALIHLGLGEDLTRAHGKKIRCGKGTKRGRKYKKKKSVLIIVSKDENIKKAAKNIAGVSVSKAIDVSVEDLAPGASPARLTVYSSSALKDLEKRFGDLS